MSANVSHSLVASASNGAMVKQCKLKAQLQITERVKSLEIQQVQTVSLYLNQMTNSQLCLSLPSPICSVTGCHARALQSTTSLSPAPLCTSVHNFQSVPFLSVSSIRLKVAFGRPLGFLLSSGALPASTGHFVPGVCDVSTSLRRLYATVFNLHDVSWMH